MFSDPVKNLKMFGLKENDIVVDLGAGTGFYSIPAGALVPRGKVYAVELQKDFLETIKNKVKEAHLENIEIIWGNAEKIGGTKIGDGVANTVIASNILFQIEDKENFVLEVKRILGPGGRIVVVDWSDSFGGIGPAKEAIYPLDKAIQLFEKAGFADAEILLAGDHHYGFVMRKKQ